SSRFIPGGPDAPMQTLARLVQTAGIRRVRGDIIGDASAFDAKRVPDGWLARNLEYSYAARVSPLSLNENLVAVWVAPESGRASVTLQPASSAIPIKSTVRVIAGSGAAINVRRLTDGSV